MPCSRTVYLCAIDVWFHHWIKMRTSWGGAQDLGRLRSSTCDYAPQPGFKCRFSSSELLPQFTYLGAKWQSCHEWARESQDFVYYCRSKFCSKICFYSQQKCVNYLHKTNVRADLCSKNKCLTHVFVLAKNFILVCCVLVDGERESTETRPPQRTF